MGDSGFTEQLSLFAFIIIISAIVAFIFACCVRKRIVRVLVGVYLLAIAAFCIILSAMAALLVAVLGVIALILATKKSQDNQSETKKKEACRVFGY